MPTIRAGLHGPVRPHSGSGSGKVQSNGRKRRPCRESGKTRLEWRDSRSRVLLAAGGPEASLAHWEMVLSAKSVEGYIARPWGCTRGVTSCDSRSKAGPLRDEAEQ